LANEAFPEVKRLHEDEKYKEEEKRYREHVTSRY